MFDLQADYRSARRFDVAGETQRFAALVGDQGWDAVIDAFRLARDRNDLTGTIAGGRLLARKGRLPDIDRPSFAGALVAEGLNEEAIEILYRVAMSRLDAGRLRYFLAEQLAVLGRFAEARQVLQKAVRVDPDDVRISNLLRRVKWLPQMAEPPRTWERVRLLIEGCMIVGALRSAAEHLESLRTDPPDGEPEPEDALRLVESGLALGHAKAVKVPLKAMPEKGLDPDRYATAVIRMAGQLGLGPEAAKRADARTPPLGADAGLEGEPLLLRRKLRYHAAEAWAQAGRLEDAVRQLGALVTQDRRDYAALTALQRCSGDAVLRDIGGVEWAEPRPPRIINLLPFYNERLLMEMRLAEMGDWVDHFVVVEAGYTFTGARKPLNFADMRAGLGDRRDQLLSVTIDAFPDWCDTAWARDFRQRDMAVAALKGRLRPDDIILITDADEIVDRRALEGFWPHLASLRMVTSKHFLNYQSLPGNPHAYRRSGAICRGEHLARFGITYIRTALSAARKSWESAPNAGWHFTSLGAAETVVAKLAAYAHQEEGKAAHRDLDAMAQWLDGVRAGAYEDGWAARPVDETFPRFVRDNPAKVASLVLETPR